MSAENEVPGSEASAALAGNTMSADNEVPGSEASAAPAGIAYDGVVKGKYSWDTAAAGKRDADKEMGASITKYSWSDGKKTVSIYVELENLDDVPDDALSVNSGAKEVSLTVSAIGSPPKTRKLVLSGLSEEITGVKLTRKKGKNMVSLKLQKKEETSWYKLLAAEGGGGGGGDDEEEGGGMGGMGGGGMGGMMGGMGGMGGMMGGMGGMMGGMGGMMGGMGDGGGGGMDLSSMMGGMGGMGGEGDGEGDGESDGDDAEGDVAPKDGDEAEGDAAPKKE